jgi:hypothetical protein
LLVSWLSPAVGEGNGGSEVVLGEVPVSARLTMGSDRMRLFFTRTRIIAAHAGKSRTGTGASTSLLLGSWGSGIAGVFGRGKKSVGSQALEILNPSDILRWDKDNFSIKYDEVVSAELVEGELYTVIKILTGEEKLEFHTGKHFDDVASLMGELLGAKLTVRRAPSDASGSDDR